MIDRIPLPEPPTKRPRGRQQTDSDRLIRKALIIMIMRRLYSAYSLFAFLEQATDLTVALCALLTEQACFPRRRTWERRLARLPDRLPSLIGCFGCELLEQVQPWGRAGQAAAIGS